MYESIIVSEHDHFAPEVISMLIEVKNLLDENLRKKALVELSKNRENFTELGLIYLNIKLMMRTLQALDTMQDRVTTRGK